MPSRSTKKRVGVRGDENYQARFGNFGNTSTPCQKAIAALQDGEDIEIRAAPGASSLARHSRSTPVSIPQKKCHSGDGVLHPGSHQT